tara:strand:- start:662 stop:997 length:336 start_codon:yes stop_codon:yes gene_type:complete
MPLLSVSTSIKITQKNSFLKNCSEFISKITKKPEKYVMVRLLDEIPMYFNKDQSSSCFIELKSIGSLNPQIMSGELSNFITNEIGIPIDRIYICFEDIEPTNWAWNGKTFG